MSSSAVCGRSSQSGEVNCAQKLARSRHSRTIISSTCSQLIFVIAVLGPTHQCFDSPDLVSVQYQSEECCCCVPSPSLSILRSSFPPSSARSRKQIGEHREIGKIKYFLNIKYFWSGSFNIFYGAPPFSQLNCNRELQTGAGN